MHIVCLQNIGAITIDQYRAAIGLFVLKGSRKMLMAEMFFWQFIFLNFIFCHLVLPGIIQRCGDIESNPGPANRSHDPKIKIGHVNIRSLTSKVKDPNNPELEISKFCLVKHHLEHYQYKIFGISETWLDGTVSDADISIGGYSKPIRRDFSRQQRGVLVYLSNDLPAKHRDDLDPVNSEIICVEIQIKFKKALIINCYRVPHQDMLDFCSDLNDVIDKASEEFDDIVIMGDMNARNTLFWNHDITNTDGRILNAFFRSLSYEELVHEPTRIVGETKTCIDLMFTNNPLIFSEIGTYDKIHPTNDHQPIFGTLKFTLQKPKCFKRWVWDFKKGNYDQLRMNILNAN